MDLMGIYTGRDRLQMTKTTSKPLRMLSLFAGIGGFDLAAQMVGGIETTQICEINPFCQQILKKHFPNVPIHSDIKDYEPITGAFDIVAGGSPCQDLSIAGKQKGIIEGERSSLWFEMLRVIDTAQPRFVVWENVRGSHSSGGLPIVCECLHRSGYNFDVEIISAEEIGAHHQRERIFVVAYPDCVQQSIRGKILCSWAEQIRGHIKEIRAIGCLEKPQPSIRRVVNGISDRLHRGRALGNSIVPAVAAIALKRVLYLNQLAGTVT
jgi:DNA (cytosine-5)-methyltransferase 1